MRLGVKCRGSDFDGSAQSFESKASTAAHRWPWPSEPLVNHVPQAEPSWTKCSSHHSIAPISHTWHSHSNPVATNWHDKGDLDSACFALEIPVGHEPCNSSMDLDIIGCTTLDVFGLGNCAALSLAELHQVFDEEYTFQSQRYPYDASASSSSHGAIPSDQRVEEQMMTPLLSIRRRISNSTGLRHLFVTSAMFGRLLGDLNVGAKTPGTCGRPIIDTTIVIRDVKMRDWPVAFRASISSKQYHRSLKKGWSRFCVANKVCVGDVVEFRRLPEKGIILHAQVCSTR